MYRIKHLIIGLMIISIGVILLPRTALPLESFGWPFLQAYSAPDMAVIGNGQVIVNGDTTPTTADDTDFGTALISSGQITHTFTISNSGDADLTLTGVPQVGLSGPTSSNFSVTIQPTSPISAGNISTFDITFAPSTSGQLTATVTITNNDTVQNPYTFVISGTGSGVALSIGKTAQAVPNTITAEYHGLITYTVTLTNSGPDDVAGTLLTDTLPGGVVNFARFVSPPTPANASASGGVITWSGTVTANSVISFSYVVTHVGNYSDALSNSAQFLHPTTSQSDTVQSTVTIASAPNIGISKQVAPASIGAGQTITYTLTFSNSGGSVATGIIITDAIPLSVTNTSVTSSGVAITDTGAAQNYVWLVQDLASNEAGIITITGQVSATLANGSHITNMASITGSTPDSNTANNNATVDTSVSSLASGIYLPLIFKDFIPGPDLVIVPGSLIASTTGVTLTIMNQGTEAVVDAFWVDVYYGLNSAPVLNQLGDVYWGLSVPNGAVPIAPGEVITLTFSSSYFATSRTPPPAGTTIYGQVDSVGPFSYGAVPETNEGNNVSGPTTSVTATGGILNNSRSDFNDAGLPLRN